MATSPNNFSMRVNSLAACKGISYIAIFLAFLFAPIPMAAQTDSNPSSAPAVDDISDANPAAPSKRETVIPPARRPMKADSQKCSDRKAEDASDDDDEKRRDTFKYGITTEVVQLLTDLISKDDPRYTEEAYNLFQETRSNAVKEKTLEYFAKFSDPCLADFACTVLNEYYDNKTPIIAASLQYAGEVKCTEAIGAIENIIDEGDEKFWQAAMTALGKTGGNDEAKYLTELFKNEAEEMTVVKKQSLVRALGLIHATGTWEALVDMAENEDENTFVRMYAAEAIGKMGLVESIPVLTGIYSSNDPNLREYALKGLACFKDNKDANSTIIEAIKDAHPKVRIEAINDAAELMLKDSSPLIVFRAKSDGESSVKRAAFTALAKLGTSDGVAFLCDLLADKKASDGAKKQAAESLLKAGDAGDKAIADAALDALADDKKKPLRRTLGNVIARQDKAAFASVCKAYLESNDSDTVSLGLDMYKRAKYASAANVVQTIAETKGNNKMKAMKILGIKEDN